MSQCRDVWVRWGDLHFASGVGRRGVTLPRAGMVLRVSLALWLMVASDGGCRVVSPVDRPVRTMRFHDTIFDVLVTSADDGRIKVWNVQEAVCLATVTAVKMPDRCFGRVRLTGADFALLSGAVVYVLAGSLRRLDVRARLRAKHKQRKQQARRAKRGGPQADEDAAADCASASVADPPLPIGDISPSDVARRWGGVTCFCGATDPDGVDLLVVGYEHGRVLLLQLNAAGTCTTVRSVFSLASAWMPVGPPVRGVAISPTRSKVLGFGAAGGVHVWNAVTGDAVRVLAPPPTRHRDRKRASALHAWFVGDRRCGGAVLQSDGVGGSAGGGGFQAVGEGEWAQRDTGVVVHTPGGLVLHDFGHCVKLLREADPERLMDSLTSAWKRSQRNERTADASSA